MFNCAIESQIAVAFGDNVFEAITSSQAWSQEIGEIETKYVQANIYLAQLLMIGMTVGWTSFSIS